MLRDLRTWIPLALTASLLLACATTRGGSTTAPPVPGEAACERSVEADVETARGRMRDGRPDRALLYVEALAGCPEAVAYGPFLDLALDVFEETGRLNEAWNVARVRLDQATLEQDLDAERAVRERMDRFVALYVLVQVDQDGRRPPKVRYAGPVQDEATSRQLAALDAEKGVWIGQGVLGFWLYPGRYEVDDEVRDLQAGAVVSSAGGAR